MTPQQLTKQSVRVVVLFAALTAGLSWLGVFSPREAPFDTTSSEAALPALPALPTLSLETMLDAKSACRADCGHPFQIVAPMAFVDVVEGARNVVGGDVEPAPAAGEAIETDEPPEAVVEFVAQTAQPLVPEGMAFNGEPLPGKADEVDDSGAMVVSSPLVFEDVAGVSAGGEFSFTDSFDDLSEWQLFEQIVGGPDGCYRDNLAAYSTSDGPDPWLELTANAPESGFSSHPILGRKLDFDAVSGLYRLSVMARVDEDSGTNLQTGPEFSVQNTVVSANGDLLTQTFGVQYVELLGTYDWNIWAAFGDEIGWRQVHKGALEPGVWYEISMVFDTGSGVYHELSVEGPGGFAVVFDGVETLWQDKAFADEAVWITLEVENLYTCADPRELSATVSYDSLAYTRLG